MVVLSDMPSVTQTIIHIIDDNDTKVLKLIKKPFDANLLYKN